MSLNNTCPPNFGQFIMNLNDNKRTFNINKKMGVTLAILTSVERNTTMRHTKAQVLDQFRYNWKVAVISDKSLKGDAIAKREYWNNFVDSLNKEGLVSDNQANNWTNPF